MELDSPRPGQDPRRSAGAGNRTRRVLLLTSHPIDGQDGADKEIAVGLARGLPELAFTFFGRAGHPTPAPGHRVLIISRTGSPGLLERAQVALRVPALVRSSDLVHAVMTIGPRYAAWSRSIWSTRGRPTLLTVPGVVSRECLTGSRPLGITVALSSVTADLLCNAGYPDVRVVPPGIDLTRWRRVPRPDGTRPSILFAGHAGPHGGSHQAIDVAARVERLGLPVRLVLALRTRPGQDGVAERLAAEQTARRAGVTDVKVHGRVESMTDLVAAADIVLFTPARLDGGKADLPLVVVEALATGRPVVATRLPQFAALDGVVTQVPPGAVEQAADAVRVLLTEPRAWAEHSVAGRHAVEQNYSSDRMCRSYAAIYAELLDDHGLRRRFPPGESELSRPARP